MARSLLVVLALAGCSADDDYPIGGGNGGPPGQGTRPDAGLDASDGGVGVLRSRVCVVTDLRQPVSCATRNNVGVVVRELGTQNQTTTGANGFFDLAVTARDVAILEVGTGSAALVPSIVAVDVPRPAETVPVPSAAEYNALVAALGAIVPDGTGVIAEYFLDRSNRPLPGVVIELAGGAQNGPWYDLAGDLSPPPWTTNAETGPYGAALLFGVAAGDAVVPATGPGLEDLTLDGIRVVADRVTFVSQRLP